jgi:3-mercaptopropionate dioxygenase
MLKAGTEYRSLTDLRFTGLGGDDMTKTLRRLHPALNQLVVAVRGAVGVRADWPTTAELVADQLYHVGEVSGFAPPGDIHRVCNQAATTAISLHIYGTDVSRVGSSVRRYYD